MISPGRPAVSALLASCALALSSCASFEPDPCTPDWVEWKKDRILSEFARSHRSEMRTLRSIRDSLDGDQSSVFQVAGIALAAPRLGQMAQDFVDLTVPEVRTALVQCGYTAGATPLFVDMLRGDGFDEDTIVLVQQIGPIVEALNAAPAATAP